MEPTVTLSLKEYEKLKEDLKRLQLYENNEIHLNALKEEYETLVTQIRRKKESLQKLDLIESKIVKRSIDEAVSKFKYKLKWRIYKYLDDNLFYPLENLQVSFIGKLSTDTKENLKKSISENFINLIFNTDYDH